MIFIYLESLKLKGIIGSFTKLDFDYRPRNPVFELLHKEILIPKKLHLKYF